MFPATATRGLELAIFLGLVSPLLGVWFETVSASSRLSYALLVPALALVLALRAPGESPDEASQGARERSISRFSGSALWAALGAFALLGGTLSGVFTLSLLALPLATIAFVERLCSPSARRRLWPALAFLFLMVPPPMPILDRINPFLTAASGETAVRMLLPFDGAASWAGSTLVFRGWTLIVAEVCSGSGTFLMLGTLSAFLAGLFRMRLSTAIGLILSSLPLTLAVNGLRIASSAMVIDRFGAAAGEGLAHELLGQAVVIFGAALLVLVVERSTSRAGLECRT